MTFPLEIPKAKVLITVKTYPQPSNRYGELVCTAGLLDGKQWVRIYPIPFRYLNDSSSYPKYTWIELDLIRRHKDFRPESYSPKRGLDEDIIVGERIGTDDKWRIRKEYILGGEVFTSMENLIIEAKGKKKKSLATLKPKEITRFIIKDDDRDWKEKWLAQNEQGNIFEVNRHGQMKNLNLVKKLPYKFYYEFTTEGDKNLRRLMIEDWEIGALFWNCLDRCDGDEEAAKDLVRKKYYDDFGVYENSCVNGRFG